MGFVGENRFDDMVALCPRPERLRARWMSTELIRYCICRFHASLLHVALCGLDAMVALFSRA